MVIFLLLQDTPTEYLARGNLFEAKKTPTTVHRVGTKYSSSPIHFKMTAIDFAGMFEDCLKETHASEVNSTAEETFRAVFLASPPHPTRAASLHEDCVLLHEFVTTEEASALEDVIFAPEGAQRWPWHDLANRRLQNLGGYPHPEGLLQEDLPSWARLVCERVERCDELNCGLLLNQVLLNEYQMGQGIAAHKDGDELYEKCAVILSLGEEAVMRMTPDEGEGGEGFDIVLPPRSLLVFKGALFSNYTHCIPCTEGVPAGWRRLSLTMRHALLPEEVGGSELCAFTEEGKAEMERRKNNWIRAVTNVVR